MNRRLSVVALALALSATAFTGCSSRASKAADRAEAAATRAEAAAAKASPHRLYK